MLRDLSPRCGKSVIAYELPGRAAPDKYLDCGRLIREAREALGMTQAQLAAAVGAYGFQAVGKWEAGERYPSKGAAELERVLGIRLPGPRCGRPEGHSRRTGCRSEAAVVRYYKQDAARRDAASAGWPAARRAAA